MLESIDELATAKLVAKASLRDVEGDLRHALEAPGNEDLGVAEFDGLRRQRDCLHAEAHTLLTVVQGVACARPAPRATCRAGACPRLAETTLPR